MAAYIITLMAVFAFCATMTGSAYAQKVPGLITPYSFDPFASGQSTTSARAG